MIEMMKFWLAKAAVEFALACGLILLAALAVVVVSIVKAIRQGKCKHTNCYETGACDAICRDCGKNLGFIGNVRDRK